MAYEELEDMRIPCYPNHPNYLEEDHYIIWSRTKDISNDKNNMILESIETPWKDIRIMYMNLLDSMNRMAAIKTWNLEAIKTN